MTALPAEIERPPKSALARRWGMSDDMLEIIRRAVAPGAPDEVLELLFVKCKALGCDPLERFVHVIPRSANVKDEKTGEWRREIRWTIQGAIDLFRSIAEQSGDYGGQLGPFWSNDGKNWSDVWLEAEPPKVCKIGVLRHTFKEPLWVVGTYDYYVPRDGKGNPVPGPFWRGEKGAHQLAKCVEELALRKAFPKKLGGVYGNEEMAQAARPTAMKAAAKVLTDTTPEPPSPPSQPSQPEPTTIDAEIIEEPRVEAEVRSTMPDEYRRKTGIGEVHKFLDKGLIARQDYEEILIDLFGVKRFRVCGRCRARQLEEWSVDPPCCEACGQMNEIIIEPTSKFLELPEIERLWLAVNDRVKRGKR